MTEAKLVYERLSIEDILEVGSPCFQEGNTFFPERRGYPRLDSRLLSMLTTWAEKAHRDSVAELRGLTSKCDHGRDCGQEYLCEVLAAYILMPQNDFVQRLDDIRTTWRAGCGWDPILWLAAIYIVEPWAVRFRIALMDEGFFDPYRDWVAGDPAGPAPMSDPYWDASILAYSLGRETPT